MSNAMAKTKGDNFSFEEEATTLHGEIKGGELQYGLYLDSSSDLFDEAAKAHCENEDNTVQIFVSFKPSLLLDEIIQGAAIKDENFEKTDVLSADSRPLIEALKLELETMLKRISEVEYEEPANDYPRERG